METTSRNSLPDKFQVESRNLRNGAHTKLISQVAKNLSLSHRFSIKACSQHKKIAKKERKIQPTFEQSCRASGERNGENRTFSRLRISEDMRETTRGRFAMLWSCLSSSKSSARSSAISAAIRYSGRKIWEILEGNASSRREVKSRT